MKSESEYPIVRIAFVRSVDIRQAFPVYRHTLRELRNAGHTVATFVVDDTPPPTGIGECHHLPGRATPDGIANALTQWRPDRVVSISIPDDKALRDSLAFARLTELSPDVVAVHHPVDATHLFSSKWETREIASRAGIPTAKGLLVNGDLIHRRGVAYDSYIDFLRRRLNALTFPVISKPVWDSMAQGITTYVDPESLLQSLIASPPATDVVIEEFLDGELFGIEVIGHDGKYYTQPLIRKCTGADDDFVPFNHIRFGPITHTSYGIDALATTLLSLAADLGLQGSAEFEFIWSAGRFHLIEINPRVSGMTNLSTAISGINTYTVLAAGVSRRLHPQRFVVEIPLTADVDRRTSMHLADEPDVLSLESVVYHDGTTQTKMLLTAHDPSAALARITSLQDRYHAIDGHVAAEFESAVLASSDPYTHRELDPIA